jgi:hypothetical protein
MTTLAALSTSNPGVACAELGLWTNRKQQGDERAIE